MRGAMMGQTAAGAASPARPPPRRPPQRRNRVQHRAPRDTDECGVQSAIRHEVNFLQRYDEGLPVGLERWPHLLRDVQPQPRQLQLLPRVRQGALHLVYLNAHAWSLSFRRGLRTRAPHGIRGIGQMSPCRWVRFHGVQHSTARQCW